MLNIFICEDDRKFLDFVVKHVENYIAMSKTAMSLVCAATTPEEVLGCLDKNQGSTGLYFLDLHLDADMNGIDLAEAIRRHDARGFIVFITSDALSYKLTFKHKVEALDYIVKGEPQLMERIYECLDNAVSKFAAKTAVQDHFVFKLADDVKKSKGVSLAEGSTICIDNNKILCFITEPDIKHTVTVYTTDGERMQFGGSLRQVEAKLDKQRFFRCQNNLIANMDKVIALDPIQLLLIFESGLSVSVATRAVRKLNERIAKK